MKRIRITWRALQNLWMFSLVVVVPSLGLAQVSLSTSSGNSYGRYVPPDGGSVEIQLTAKEDWTVSADADWLRLDASSGGPGSWRLNLSYDCNPSSSHRTAHVRIGGATLTITQTAGSVCPWNVDEQPQYSIFYGSEFAGDLELVRAIMDRGLEIMREKYRLNELPFKLKIFLHTRPNSAADQNTARTSGSGTGFPVWIDYLTPSAPEWKTAGKSSLSQEKDSPLYHRQTIIHEFAHVIQMAITGTYYQFPSWVYEGLAHYEGVFNSSAENRASAREYVGRWIKFNPQAVVCCKTLGPDGLAVTDAYNGGSFFWYALAEAYGEDLHRRVLEHPSRNIAEVLTAETGVSLEEIHSAVKGIFEKLTAEIRAVVLSIHSISVSSRPGSLQLSWTAASPWVASTSAPWLRFPLSRGIAGTYGGYALSWDANPYCSGRTATLTIGDAVLKVTQEGATGFCLPDPATP